MFKVVKMYMENMENLCLIINIELIDDYPHTTLPQISMFIGYVFLGFCKFLDYKGEVCFVKVN